MKDRAPLTRYDFISQLAEQGRLANINDDGWIFRPLRPRDAPRSADPEPTVHVYKGPPVALRVRKPFTPWPV